MSLIAQPESDLVPVYLADVGSTPTTVVANRPCSLGGLAINSTNSQRAYLQFFDAPNGESVKVGSSDPLFSVPIQGTNGFVGPVAAGNVKFFKGMVVAATTSRNGNTGPSNPLSVSLFIVRE